MSLSAQLFGRDSFIHRATNVLGLGVPGWLDRKFGVRDVETSPTIPTVQDSAYGNPIPSFEGMVGTSGNVIWLKGGTLDFTTKKKSGGKGGQSQAQTITTFFATFALALGEGEILAIRRMWCADKLIFNAGSDDLETIIASNQAAKGWKLYRGTDDQLPDPDIQADKGPENTPAYRGLAYIKFKKFKLTDYGDSLAGTQFKIEVVAAGDLDGYRRLIGVTIPQDFARASSAGGIGAGRPWMRVPDGNMVVTTSLGTEFVYRLDGTFVTQRPPTGSFPEPTGGGRYYVGYMSTSKYALTPGDIMVSVENLGSAFGDDQVIAPAWLQQNLPADRYCAGITIAADGARVLILTGDNAIEADGYFIVNPDGDVVDSGVLAEPLSSSSFGFGVVGQHDYAASMLEADADFVWSAAGFSNGQVTLYQIEDGVMTEVGALNVGNGQGLVDYNFTFPSINVVDGVAYIVSGNSLNVYTRTDQLNQSRVPISQIIRRQVNFTNLISDADIDVSMLTDSVSGYKIVGGSCRDNIEPLRSAWPFDVRMHGYKLQFVPRGQASVVSVPQEDLAATDSDEIGDSLYYDREMDTQLPARVTVKGLSSVREYADSSQSYDRIGTLAVKTETVDLGLVLSDDELAQVAEKLCELAWLERQPFDFSLPPPYHYLEPGDVVTVQSKFGIFEIRLTEVSTETNGIVTCKGMPSHAPLYTSYAVGAPSPGPDGTIGVTGATLMVVADAPMVYETIQNEPGLATAATGYASAWVSAVLVRSADNGQTWSELQGYDGRGSIGYASNTIPVSGGTVIYEGPGLRVGMVSGELESITRDQMLAGGNIALYGANGRWEVIRFRDATLQADGTYILTGLVRGDFGTEWATGLHQVGDLFVMVDDPDNIFVSTAVATIGVEMLYRGITAGASIDSAPDQAVTYQGVNLKPLRPVDAHGKRASGNFTGTFVRRSRFSSSWWVTGVPAPIGETSESYEIDVMSGSTVKRTIAVTSPTWTYSSADQTTDFGSPQSSITFRIYQLSSVVGRGYPLEVTL